MNFEKFIEAIKIGNLFTIECGFTNEYFTQSDVNGHLPIHVACMGKSVEIVKFLIQHGCNIEACDKNGWRPIHHAISKNNLEIIKVLIGFGCELDCIKKQNESLLDFATQTNQKEMIDAIRKSSKNKKIAREMNLKCYFGCDHRFCLQSFCLNEFDYGEKLIRGHYGTIYNVKESHGDRYFAMKKISWKPLITDVDGDIQKEAKFVENNINEHKSKLTHNNIVKYFGAIVVEYKIFIFMEYLPGGSLSEKISKYYRNGLPEETIFKYSHQILEGLHFLHENDIIHKNVQTNNILLDENDKCKLTNIGMSRLLETITKYTIKTKMDVTLTNEKSAKKQKIYYGVTNYMAPEIILGEKYSDKSDIWSLGATVFEMYTGKPPFYNQKQNFVLMEIGRGHQPEYPDEKYFECPRIISFIDKMLLSDPNERPSAESLLHNWFLWTISTLSLNK